VASADGQEIIRVCLTDSDSVRLGRTVAEQLLKKGAERLLRSAKG
jgi:porphobilinogen deaminase